KTYKEMQNAIREGRGDAFGWFMNGISRIRGAIGFEGGDLNKMSVEDGLEYLRLGVSRGRYLEKELGELTAMLRNMRAQGISDHVIMAALRDPRLHKGEPPFNDLADFDKEFRELARTRYGATVDTDAFGGAAYALRNDTPFGRVLQTAHSNRTSGMVEYLRDKNTDLLTEGRASLDEMAERSNAVWEKIAPYAAFSQVVDQVVVSVAASAALAGVFARAASFTKIPQMFNAARGLAAGMSAPARLAMLAGVNATEAGLGMLTGSAISKVGTGIFGEGSLGAKAFEIVGSGLQLSAGSATALRFG